MKIRVLGSGCAKCKTLEERIRQLIAKNNLNIEVEKVTDLKEIMSYGILSTPGLVIDGVLKSAGSVPKDEQLLAWMGGAKR
jgi:small redox-active disulfide protein 2